MNNLIDKIVAKQLEENINKNWVIAPVGFDVIITLLSQFANDEAQKELLKILNIEEEQRATYLQKLSKTLTNEENPSAVFLASRTDIEHTNHYLLDEELIQSTNQFLELDLIKTQDINPFIKMTNIFKFEDTWRNIYYQKENIQVFTNDEGEEFGVQLVGRDNTEAVTFDNTYYFETDDFQAIRLPLREGYGFEMYLPKKGKTLVEVSKQLQYQQLLDYHASFKQQKYYNVFFPAFKIENKLRSVETLLQEIGVNQIFNTWDSLSKLIKNNYPFKVFSIGQDTKIEVDEHGIKAEAFTFVLGVGSISEAGKYIVFKANRPFLFLVRNINANKILLLGNYFQPSEEENLEVNEQTIIRSRAEEIFNEQHLALKHTTVRAKLALGLNSLKLFLETKQEKHIFFDSFFENIWKIIEGKDNWLEDETLKNDLGYYQLLTTGYIDKESLIYDYYKTTGDKKDILPIIDNIATTALNCFPDLKREGFFGRDLYFHPVIANLKILISNAIDLPNLKQYIRFEGENDELGLPIDRTVFQFD